MIAEWVLITGISLWNGTVVPIPMQSVEACKAAVVGLSKDGNTASHRARCINTKTGEVVKP